MANANYAREAIWAAQRLLQSETPRLIVDGRWGQFTQAAYDRASEVNKIRVDGVLSGSGLTAASLIAQNALEKKHKDPAYLAKKDAARKQREIAPSPEVQDAISSASKVTGIPVAWLMGMARIESGFRPDAENGSSRGLFQIQPAAWTDVQKTDPSVGSYSNWRDPVKNSLVGARYMLINRNRLRGLGFTEEITPAHLYFAHQQGAAGFMELWKSAVGRPVTTSHVTEEKMTKNPPQDKLGVTLNKREFFRRWIAVAERQLGTN